ncbi:FAD-linked sulfhydryl oxidase ALR [Phyllosticta citribraziliensis]|uniref:Sulfhydryl oxidase n=1 Tax=Phyllosticta citribraziliensis TaxID=989973 RepID=A0ABR1LE78_9PEZI
MPLTFADVPILSRFLCAVEKNTGEPAQPEAATTTTAAMDNTAGRRDDDQPASTTTAAGDGPKKLPKGVVLGPDGKPCRSCTSFASWAAMTKAQTKGTTTSSSPTAAATTVSQPQPPPDCPPDVEALGRSTWTLLHSITATYPVTPSPAQQDNARGFLRSFASLYPCWVCADDFQGWMKVHAPRVSSRDEFGRWMCEAHNAVNVKLGKDVFECSKWEERWRTGWRDGRCDE